MLIVRCLHLGGMAFQNHDRKKALFLTYNNNSNNQVNFLLFLSIHNCFTCCLSFRSNEYV